MSHHIYTTPAMVLASVPSREADRRYTLFTPQFGVVWATALGVRRDVSKLRYALQEFSVLSVSLVRGREQWRITNTSVGQNIFWQQRDNQALVEVVARIFRLLIRLVPGEEQSEQLYHHVVEALYFVKKNAPSGVQLEAFEHIAVLRILHDLGYVSASNELTIFVKNVWSEELIVTACIKRKMLIAAINFSLHQSQL